MDIVIKILGYLNFMAIYANLFFVHRSVILDDFYTRGSCDSNFIKDINSKMRVPDRISLDPSSLPQVNLSLDSSENDNMKVPERIVMSGAQNQSSPLMAFNRRGGRYQICLLHFLCYRICI